MSRSTLDVKTTPVLRVAGCAYDHSDLSPVLECDHCHRVPTYDPDPSDPKVPIALQLQMVASPDRKNYLFLGPDCLMREQQRYVNGGEPK